MHRIVRRSCCTTALSKLVARVFSAIGSQPACVYDVHLIEESAMANDQLKEYLATDTEVNALKGVPDVVMAALNAHLELYRRDPEAAHYWDPALIGVPGGPVKTLMLSYTGRKSGRTLQTALQYFERDGQVAIVASRGGTEDHPLWYLNLVAQPKCEIQIGKNAHQAMARTIEGAERDAWWKIILVDQPIQAVYQARTSRLIPVVVMDII
jgi:deazaflavin-dependent oxidoreductase (nitroreductase family)